MQQERFQWSDSTSPPIMTNVRRAGCRRCRRIRIGRRAAGATRPFSSPRGRNDTPLHGLVEELQAVRARSARAAATACSRGRNAVDHARRGERVQREPLLPTLVSTTRPEKFLVSPICCLTRFTYNGMSACLGDRKNIPRRSYLPAAFYSVAARDPFCDEHGLASPSRSTVTFQSGLNALAMFPRRPAEACAQRGAGRHGPVKRTRFSP